MLHAITDPLDLENDPQIVSEMIGLTEENRLLEIKIHPMIRRKIEDRMDLKKLSDEFDL